MVKGLTKVGNSQAVILPKQMIVKFKLGRTVMIEETEEGILIKAIQKETSFQRKLRLARKNKEAIYKRMKKDANDPEIQAYYSDPKNTLDDVDQEILDDY